ncbi:MAG: energy transducer TonB [Thermodesulfobacteriota bacterium]|nr:energy transducer TonB [Thermodesulfobacteriota bacterium]
MKNNKNFFIAVIGSIIVNIFIFALLPIFGERGVKGRDLETIIPVNFVQLRKIEPSPPPEEEERLPEKRPPELIPTVRMQNTIPKRQLKIELPRLSFEINPKLSCGMPVAAPKYSYDEGDVDQIPIPIFKMKPIYPYYARKLNIEGYIEVKFLVDENGGTDHITILDSKPPGIFERSVIKAIPSWRFSPGKIEGKPVCTWVITKVQFKIEDK